VQRSTVPAPRVAAQATAASPTAARAAHPWIVSPAFDVAWILAGLWMLLGFAASVHLGVDEGLVSVIAATGATLALVHAWSTTWTVIGSPLFAEARAARPIELYAVPALVMVLSLLVGVEVMTGPTFGPGEGFGWQHWGYALYIGSFVALHFFHFAQQDFGVLSLYRHRAGQREALDRRVDLFFARFVTMGCMPLLNLKLFVDSPFQTWMLSWQPLSLSTVLVLADGAFVLAMLVSAAAVAYELRKPTMSTPKVLYMLIMGLHPLTLYFANFTGYALVYIYSHWIIAIALSWRLNRNYNVSAPQPARAWITYALGFGACIALSAGIHFGLGTLGLFSSTAFREHVGHAGLLMGLVTGFALGEQLTHYYYDRVLFRFADPYVRKHVGPLLR